MSELTPKQRVLKALRGEPVDRIPVISVCQYATYELMQKTNAFWPEAHENGEKMAALSGGGASVLNLDAVRVPYCQTVEAEAYGAEIKSGGANNFPSVAKPPYQIGETPAIPDDFLNRGRIPEVLKSVRLLKEQFGEERAIIGGVVGPFSVATSLVGIPQMLKASFRKPESVIPYIEAAIETGEQLANAYLEAGADIIAIEDMMASLDMISPKIYRSLVLPYEKELISRIKAPVILHICGKLDNVMLDVASTGADAVSVESAVNIPAAKEVYQNAGISTVIIGAVHPMQVLLEGTPQDVKSAVQASEKDGVGLISPGCAVPPNAPLENLIALKKAVTGEI